MNNTGQFGLEPNNQQLVVSQTQNSVVTPNQIQDNLEESRYQQEVNQVQDTPVVPNKLGMVDESIIDNLVKYKMGILNSNFTFNEKERELDYLKKIHAFLFGDIYEDAGVFSKRVDAEVLDEASNLIKYINSLFEYVNYDETIEEIKIKMNELIDLQLFDDGNKRTISTYCRIILEEYQKNKTKGSII